MASWAIRFLLLVCQQLDLEPICTPFDGVRTIVVAKDGRDDLFIGDLMPQLFSRALPGLAHNSDSRNPPVITKKRHQWTVFLLSQIDRQVSAYIHLYWSSERPRTT